MMCAGQHQWVVWRISEYEYRGCSFPYCYVNERRRVFADGTTGRWAKRVTGGWVDGEEEERAGQHGPRVGGDSGGEPSPEAGPSARHEDAQAHAPSPRQEGSQVADARAIQGTALIPIPRCDECAHWSRERRERSGLCRKITVGTLTASVEAGAGQSADFVTREDFGCTEWRKK